MKGLARVLKQMGHEVSGCDLKLKGHSERHISSSLDRVVFTSAITPDSPGYKEISSAKKLGITTLKRSVATSEAFKNYKTIAVSGMHGKTTVASMLVSILEKAGKFPSYNIGVPDGKVGDELILGSNFSEKGRYFVVEACEFDRSFLDFAPFIGVITNLEPEHLDYYRGGMEEILEAFMQFVLKIKPDGALLISYDNPCCQKLLARIKQIEDAERSRKGKKTQLKILTFGEKRGADLRASRIKVQNQMVQFKLIYKDSSCQIALKIPGRHNVLNALGAFGVAHLLEVNWSDIKQGLESFPGSKRRMEFIGDGEGIKVFDDYGHHPTEIKATLQALKEFHPKNRLVVLFQPHQVSRTQLLFKEFLGAFNKANLVIITDIYQVPGREEKDFDVRSQDLVWALKKKGIRAHYLPYDINLIVKYLKKVTKEKDIILTLGATDIYKIGLEFLKSG